jgi:flagellin
MAISDLMRAKIRSNSQAERNSNDSISLLQVAEGSLNTMYQVGGRLKELAIQAATDTIAESERAAIDIEFQQLKSEVERMALSTSFNGNNVLKAGDSKYDLQIGSSGNVNLDKIQYDLGRVMDASNNFGIGHINLKTKASAQSSLGSIDKMLTDINSSRAELGSMGNRINSIIQNLQVSRENLSSSNSKIRDADIAKEAAIKLKTQVSQQASIGMLKMSNDNPSVILKLVS